MEPLSRRPWGGPRRGGKRERSLGAVLGPLALLAALATALLRLVPGGAASPEANGSGLLGSGGESRSRPDRVRDLRVNLVEQGRLGGSADDVAIGGRRAYLVGEELVIVDIARPEEPERLGGLRLPLRGEAVALSGGRALVANGRMGLRIVDVADAEEAREIGHQRHPEGYAWDVAVSGTHALVAYGDLGTAVLDITDPAEPDLLIDARVEGGEASALALAGDLVLAGQWRAGLSVDRLVLGADPALDPLARVPSPLPVTDLAVAEGRAYALERGWEPYPPPGDEGLRGALSIHDIADPGMPRLLGRRAEGLRSPYRIALADGLAFVAAGADGLQVFEVSEPGAIALIGSFASPDARGVAVSGEQVFLADRRRGLVILAWSRETFSPTPGGPPTATPPGGSRWRLLLPICLSDGRNGTRSGRARPSGAGPDAGLKAGRESLPRVTPGTGRPS